MIAERKQRYRGVLCTRCGQPIPLSPYAAHKERKLKERRPDALYEFAVRSDTLRCRVCHGEAVYTYANVIDCDGSSRQREAET
jgi:hypothetical protein